MSSKELKRPLLISACLLGVNCKYSGGNNYSEEAVKLGNEYQLIPVCPEQLGGLMTPRLPSEILQTELEERRVIAQDGTDVTEQFIRGAEESLKLAQLLGCETAILKSRSPSCGSGIIYDGTFSGTKTAGDGVTAALLKKNGIKVISEEEICHAGMMRASQQEGR